MIDGDREVQRRFGMIRDIAVEMRPALEVGDWPAVGRLIAAVDREASPRAATEMVEWVTAHRCDEVIGIDLGAAIKPQADATLTIKRADGSVQKVTVLLRIDTPIEVSYYQHGGILPFVLRQLLAA